MAQIEMLRRLITQRLSAAAEEIFGVFGRTIAEYEEQISRSKLEIDRQRRLLELCRRPRVSVRVGGAAEQQDWSSGLDLSAMTPPHIKEEEEQREEQREELWPPRHDDSPPDDVDFESLRGGRNEPDCDLTLPDRPDRDGVDPERRPGPSGQRGSSEPDEEPVSGNGQPERVEPERVEPERVEPERVEPEAELSEVVDSYICTICGRAFAQRGHWAKHVQVHRKTGSKADKSFTCDICGKRLTRFDGYQKHLRIHTGEKPYGCDACGRRFSDNSNYKRHIRTHGGQRGQQS